MRKPKIIIGITAIHYRQKTVMVYASSGQFIANINGLSLLQVLNFLFSLRQNAPKNKTTIFCAYAFQRDTEFIFKDLRTEEKDRLFQSFKIRKIINDCYDENGNIFSQLKTADTELKKELAFNLSVNRASLTALNEVGFMGYNIRLQSGRRLEIKKNHKKMVLYDVFSFFGASLKTTYQKWLGSDNQLLDRSNLRQFCNDRTDNNRHRLLDYFEQYCKNESECIVKVMDCLINELSKNGINLSSYHGSGSIGSWILRKGKARSKRDKTSNQYYSYKYQRQLSPRLWDAVRQAYYGGRIEQIKYGIFNKGVYVYDINSAYAAAVMQLPIMLRKPVLTNEYCSEPFSVWHCEFDFSNLTDLQIAQLPYREHGRTGMIRYLRGGRGFYWQPEVEFVLKHFPNNIKINDGFVLPYVKAPFTEAIRDIYNLRLKLKQENNPLEKVLKLALVSIYGKFCQNLGGSFYFNRFYAGFITSFTRRKILEAIYNNNNSIISILTDAVHSTSPLSVTVSDQIGDFSAKEYVRGEYIDAGIYRLTDTNKKIVNARQGFSAIDFDAEVQSVIQGHKYSGQFNYFIGHNLHVRKPTFYNNYLQIKSDLHEVKLNEKSIRFFTEAVNNIVDTSISILRPCLDSAPYHANDFLMRDIVNDSLSAGRL